MRIEHFVLYHIAMSPAVQIVVAFHVMCHSVFGCCGHGSTACSHGDGALCNHESAHLAPCDRHAHEEAVANDSHDAQPSSSEYGDHRSGADGLPSPAQSHDCPHDSCHWLAADFAAIDSQFKGLFTPATLAVQPAIMEREAVHGDSCEFDTGRMRPLTLRLHLALGVLLI